MNTFIFTFAKKCKKNEHVVYSVNSWHFFTLIIKRASDEMQKIPFFHIISFKMDRDPHFRHGKIGVSSDESFQKWVIFWSLKSEIPKWSLFWTVPVWSPDILGTSNLGIHRGNPMDPWSKYENMLYFWFWKLRKKSVFLDPNKSEYSKSLISMVLRKLHWQMIG